MARKNEQLNLKLDREKKIKSTLTRLKKPFKDFDKDKLKSMDGLFKECAFMEVQLEELRENINTYGMIELFVQGSQKFERERPQVKTYHITVQKYGALMKQLIDLLPQEEQKKQNNALMGFVNKGNHIRSKC